MLLSLYLCVSTIKSTFLSPFLSAVRFTWESLTACGNFKLRISQSWFIIICWATMKQKMRWQVVRNTHVDFWLFLYPWSEKVFIEISTVVYTEKVFMSSYKSTSWNGSCFLPAPKNWNLLFLKSSVKMSGRRRLHNKRLRPFHGLRDRDIKLAEWPKVHDKFLNLFQSGWKTRKCVTC